MPSKTGSMDAIHWFWSMPVSCSASRSSSKPAAVART